MRKEIILVFFSFYILVYGQVLQFGQCVHVETMEYFQIDKFLGHWYVIEKFPVWYEVDGHCTHKVVQLCGRRVRIQHGYVKNSIQYILHVNSTYSAGDEAIFHIQENTVDPVGVPLSVISTDYTNYAVLYGCRVNENLQLKYVTAWIVSRSETLSADLLRQARRELNSLPDANSVYLEKVDRSPQRCSYQWTAHIQAVNVNDNHDTVEDAYDCK